MGFFNADPLYYVFARHDEGYMQALAVRAQSPSGYSRFDGLLVSFPMCFGLLLLRYAWNNVFALFTRQPKGYSFSRERQKQVGRVEEEVWVCAGGLALLVAGWYCLLQDWSTCSITRTDGCLRGWPLVPMQPSTLLYYNVELGWYIQLMLKAVLGLGLTDGGTMGAHHLATMGLIIISYGVQMDRLGLIMFALFNITNPLLHLAKLAHALELRRTRLVLFSTFAAAFFVTRVVLYPYVVARVGYESLVLVRGAWTDYKFLYLTIFTLLGLLAVMQVVWFVAICRILAPGLRGDDKALAATAVKLVPLVISTSSSGGGARLPVQGEGGWGEEGQELCSSNGGGGGAVKRASNAASLKAGGPANGHAAKQGGRAGSNGQAQLRGGASSLGGSAREH